MTSPATYGPLNLRALLICIGIEIVCLTGCAGDKKPESDTPEGKGPPAAVVVAAATQKTVPIYGEFVGNTDASQTVDIRARVEGYLENSSFKEGDFVKKGQLLFTIDRRPYDATLQEVKAKLSKAQAELTLARENVQLKQAQADLEKAQSTLIRTKQDLERSQQLYKDGAIGKQDYDHAVDDERKAQADVDNNVASVRNSKLNQKAQIDQSAAAVESAKAEIITAQLNLEYTQIKSPIAGIIGRVLVYPGNLVGKGENTLLATVSAVDPLKVRFSIAEADYLKLAKARRPGDKPIMELLLADGSVHPYKGTPKVLDRAVNSETGTIQVEAIFPNPTTIVRPGQFGRVRFKVEEKKDAVLIPQRAVQDTQGAKTAYIVEPDGKVAARSLTLGPRYEGFFVVTDGLKAGEKVIVEGQQKVRPGDQPTTTELTAEEAAREAQAR